MNLPSAGDVVHHPLFGGGATIRVKDILPPKRVGQRRGWRVAVEVIPDEPGIALHRHRVLGLATWENLVEDAARARAAAPAATPTDGGEGNDA